MRLITLMKIELAEYITVRQALRALHSTARDGSARDGSARTMEC